MPEAPPSSPSLTVQGGPLHGHHVLLDQAVDEILIGSDPDCRLCLDLPGVSPMHARVWIDLEGAVVHDTRSPTGIYVNDDRVVGQAQLRNGDILWLGAPGAEASVMIRCTLPTYGMDEPAAAAEEDALFLAEPEAPPAPPEFELAAATDGEFLVEPDPMAPQDSSTVVEAAAFGLDEPAPALAPPVAAAPAPDAFGLDLPDVFSIDEAPAAAAPLPAFGSAPAAAPAAEESDFFAAPASGFELDAPAPADLAPASSEADPFFVDAAPVPVAFEPPADAPNFELEAPHAAPPTVVRSQPEPAPEPEPEPEIAIPPVAPPPRAAIDDSRPVRAERPKPAVRTPAPKAAPAPRPAAAAPSARGGSAKLVAGLAGAVLALVVGGFFGWRALAAPQLSAATPSRVGVGQTLTLVGKNLGRADQASVRFGDKPARVLEDSGSELKVEVPELPTTAGKDTPVTLALSVGGRDAAPLRVTVFRPPHIHGLAPNVGMPGEEMTIEGAGFAAGAKVSFGSTAAEVASVSPTTLKLKVPELGAVGTQVQVSVSLASDASNALPFVVGRLPLVLAAQPRSAGPGDVVTLDGRGFSIRPGANTVVLAGRHALVLSATDTELKLVVPWTAASGDTPFEVHVQGLEGTGQGTLSLPALPDTLGLHFAAEPFEDVAGHDHAAVSWAFGPVFVLSAAGGKSAGARALEVAMRWNAAATQMKAQEVEAHALDSKPAIGFAGRPEALLEVAPEDAAGYDEDWTTLRGQGGPVTPARLALWWAAVARDVVLMQVRGEKPGQALALASEGRALVDLWQHAQKTGKPGLPSALLSELRPPQRAALELVGKRVPAAVSGPAPAGAPAPVAPLQLEGSWSGSQIIDSEGKKFVTVNFTRTGGSVTLEQAISLTVQIAALEQTRQGAVRFRLQTGTVTRYYRGNWDGEKIAGQITSDPAGKTAVGTFELMRNR